MRFPGRQVRVACACGWMVMFMLLAGCGSDGPAGNEHVEYDGTTLRVDGAAYEREATMDRPGADLPGRMVLQPVDEKRDEALALVERYGLELEGTSREGWMLVKVPDGFEMQWATAFVMRLGAPSSATIDSAQFPTPVAVAAVQDTDAADAAPVPDAEPSEADVRRLVTGKYDLLDQAGGLPVTATATGQALVLRGKVFEARKDSCRQLPHAKPGEWECTADLMVGICSGDCDPAAEEPTPKSERVRIRWDPEQGQFTHGD